MLNSNNNLLSKKLLNLMMLIGTVTIIFLTSLIIILLSVRTYYWVNEQKLEYEKKIECENKCSFDGFNTYCNQECEKIK